MEFVTSFPLSGNGTDCREFGYIRSSDDISGSWIAVTICVTGARHNIMVHYMAKIILTFPLYIIITLQIFCSLIRRKFSFLKHMK
jgi:hypothetical protein